MNQIEREVYVLDNRIKNPIDYVQSTNTIPIVFHFRDYTIPSGATAMVFVRKPSGLAVYNSAEISGNSVTVDVTTQMFIEEGFHYLQIQIANGEDDLVTFDQPVQVYKNRTDPDAAESENESSLFEELREAAQEANDAADAANEAADTANEAAQSANQAAQNANDAADSANDAADLANSAAQSANNAASAANNAADSANDAADLANDATQSANQAASAANSAAESANDAADAANQAAQAANEAAQAVEEAVSDIINDDQVSNVTTYSSQKLTTDFMESILQAALLRVYPVGAIYTSVSPTNPSAIFGGTWVSWGSGRVPVGVNTEDTNFSTVEKTGGVASNNFAHTHTVNGHTHGMSHTHTVNSHAHTTAEHTLTSKEIPSHNHSFAQGNIVAYGSGNGSSIKLQLGSQGFHSVAPNATTNNTGGGGSHSHGNTGSASPATNTGTKTATDSASPATNSKLGSVSNLQPYLSLIHI